MINDVIHDAREYHVRIPAKFDDLGLTLEAYRVYCHLVRRCNKDTRTAYPSYSRIGEDCFRGSYPNSSSASLKAKAIAAVDELIAYGLIRKELYDEGEGYKHNIYHITGQSEWKSPKTIDTCNVRKGRSGLQRSKKKSVNQDNPVNGDNSVNRGDETRLTGLTASVNRDTNSVNPTPPKGRTNLKEELKKEELKKKEYRSRDRASKLPDKNSSAKEVYASLQFLDKFEKAWCWYCKKLEAIPVDRSGRRPAPGSKKLAAIEWRDCLEMENLLEPFKQGLMAFDFNQVGIPNFCRFISMGHWESALVPDDDGADDADSFIPSAKQAQAERDRQWLEEMRLKGNAFVDNPDGSIDQEKFAFFKKHAEEVFGT